MVFFVEDLRRVCREPAPRLVEGRTRVDAGWQDTGVPDWVLADALYFQGDKSLRES
jgi:hypothetical protein